LNFDLDLDCVKVNRLARHSDQRSFRSFWSCTV